MDGEGREEETRASNQGAHITERYPAAAPEAIALEGAPTRVAVVPVTRLALRSDRPPAPSATRRANAPTERYGPVASESGEAGGEERATSRRAEATGRIGTFSATQEAAPLEEPAPEVPSSALPAHHDVVRIAAVPSEPRVEEPARTRGLFRAVEPATSNKLTEIDLTVVPASVEPSPLRRARARVVERTLRTPRVPQSSSSKWILAGAIVLSILVLAAAFAVRGATSATEPHATALTAP